MTGQERYERLSVSRGLNESQRKEYEQVMGWCAHFDTLNDEEYQSRTFNVIDNIIHNDKLDYLSKLDKIYLLICLNKTWQYYWEHREELLNINENHCKST